MTVEAHDDPLSVADTKAHKVATEALAAIGCSAGSSAPETRSLMPSSAGWRKQGCSPARAQGDLMAQAERARSADLKPGTRLRWRDTNDVVTLSHRKKPGEGSDSIPFHPGWWLEGNRGGLADFVIDHKRTDWHVIDEPAAVAGAGHIGDVPLLASEPTGQDRSEPTNHGR